MAVWHCASGHRWEAVADAPRCPVCGQPGADPEAPTVASPPPSAWSPHAVPPPPSEPLLRAEVPGFVLLQELGRGGMGVVYLARELKLDRLVALKVIRTGEWATPEQRERFLREARLGAKLDHPGIVAVHSVAEYKGQPFFVMEYVEGGNLAAAISDLRLQLADWQTAARLVERLARAVQHAHERGVVHRDLKPGNVLLHRRTGCQPVQEEGQAGGLSYEPKIADFGLARPLDQAGGTGSGTILGTPLYMAPEQAAGRSGEVGPATDVHALGVILYELLTGKTPFLGASFVDTLLAVREAAPAPPSRHRPDLPVELEAIVLRCLEKQPARRYARAADLADALAQVQASEPRPRPRRRRPRLRLLVFVAMLAILLFSLVPSSPGPVKLPTQIEEGKERVEEDAPEQVRETTNLEKAIASLTRELVDQHTVLENRTLVVLTPITGPRQARADAGELIRAPLAAALRKALASRKPPVQVYSIDQLAGDPDDILAALKREHRVVANKDSLLVLRGSFFISEHDEALRGQTLEVHVVAELLKPGTNEGAEYSAVVGAEGNDDLVKLLGMNAILQGANRKANNRELWEQLRNPPVYLHRSSVQARADSPFSVEVIRQDGTPAAPVLHAGQATVRLEHEETFEVRIDGGGRDAVYTLTVDGLDSLPNPKRPREPWVATVEKPTRRSITGWYESKGNRKFQLLRGGGLITVCFFVNKAGKPGGLLEAVSVRLTE